MECKDRKADKILERRKISHRFYVVGFLKLVCLDRYQALQTVEDRGRFIKRLKRAIRQELQHSLFSSGQRGEYIRRGIRWVPADLEGQILFKRHRCAQGICNKRTLGGITNLVDWFERQDNQSAELKEPLYDTDHQL